MTLQFNLHTHLLIREVVILSAQSVKGLRNITRGKEN